MRVNSDVLEGMVKDDTQLYIERRGWTITITATGTDLQAMHDAVERLRRNYRGWFNVVVTFVLSGEQKQRLDDARPY